MFDTALGFLPLLAPILLAGAAIMLSRGPAALTRVQHSAVQGITLAALVIAFASAGVLIVGGAASSQLIGWHGLGISVRLDAVAVIMLCLVAFVGWVVVRFALTYTNGEPGQARFLMWLLAALASVQMLVISGNVAQLVAAWVIMGAALQRLMLFYPERIAAQRAARKKALTSMVGSLALVGAAGLLIWGYGTGDIHAILSAAREGIAPATAPWAAGLLAVAAVMKSAQAPAHGWLTEVMEAPTPVSALLHAGVINAGGFLLIRFADVMLLAPGVLAALVMIGGFSALFGGLVMLTQSAVKTSLAWSTVAQMGFMILQCGLALFPLALLHIVAHSLYKAHAFLASGLAVQVVADLPKPGPVAVPGVRAVARAFGLALVIFATIALLIGVEGKSAQAIALGAILVFGVAYLLAQGLAEAAPWPLTWRTGVVSAAATLSYFLLQSLATWLTAGALPITPAPGPLEWAAIVVALISFGVIAVAQAMFPLWARHPAAAGLRVHLSNGLYLNAMFDRLIGGWATQKSK